MGGRGGFCQPSFSVRLVKTCMVRSGEVDVSRYGEDWTRAARPPSRPGWLAKSCREMRCGQVCGRARSAGRRLMQMGKPGGYSGAGRVCPREASDSPLG